MRYTQILAASTLGLLLAAGCTKAETPVDAAAKPVAVVNGTPISRDVWALYVKTRHGGKSPGDLTAEEQKDALEELIGMYTGAQEAEKQKLGEGEPKARLELVGKSRARNPLRPSSRPNTTRASRKPRSRSFMRVTSSSTTKRWRKT
jgi:hypothetical protein